MSTSTSKDFAEPLLKRAQDLTVRHSREGAMSAPTSLVAPQSPLHELLIEEVAALVPHEVALKLRASRSVADAHDWIAAAAMYSWIRSDSLLAQQFLLELNDRPKEAALALSRTVARTLEPPPPDPRAPALDRLGLAIEALFATLILGLRGVVFVSLFLLATGATWSLEGVAAQRLVTSGLLPDLIFLSSPDAPLLAVVTLLSASSWLVLETMLVPRSLRFLRNLPLRWLPRRSYTGWRLDSTPVLWVTHIMVLQFFFTPKAISFAVASRVLFGESFVWAAVLAGPAFIALIQVVVTVRYFMGTGASKHPVPG